eukprot:scaffold3800_cov137-Pinguiococcus_pyrenoidosus.AAC.1
MFWKLKRPDPLPDNSDSNATSSWVKFPCAQRSYSPTLHAGKHDLAASVTKSLQDAQGFDGQSGNNTQKTLRFRRHASKCPRFF